jgi:uncharacterized protein (TIGR03437 family)
MYKKWSCIPALMACMTLPAVHARNIFVTSGGDPAISTVSTFSTDPLSFAGTFAAIAGAAQVLPGPGGKYFVIGRVASEGIGVLQGTFPNLQVTKRLALTVAPTAAAISPDGRRLIVVGSGGVQVIDTTSDNVLAGSATLNVGTNPIGVAVSTDSRKAFVSSQDQQRLFAINLENATSAGQLSTPGTPTSVTVGPSSLVYVTVQNAIYEIDPQSLALRATISLNGFPGALAFTPDGRFGVAPNTSTLINKAGFLIDLGRRTSVDIPGGGFTLSKIVVADNSTAYGYSSQTNRVYLINLANPTTPTVFSVTNATLENVRDIVLSNEAPAARSLFVLTSGNLYRVDLAQNNAVGPVSAPVSGVLSYASSPAATGPASALLQINNTQTVPPGTSSLPLIIRAVSPDGIPLAGVQVQFAGPATVNLSNTTTTTDSLGFAQTTVSVPTTSPIGVVNVSATAGSQSVNFTVNVNNSTGGGGGGTTTGTLTIVKGQGQVTSQGFVTPEPLTVRVTDAAGKPAPNTPVTFKLEQGEGTLGVDVNKLTDENGLASAVYTNFLVPLGVPFTQAVISASTGAETVNFIITTVANLPNGSRGEATYELRKPADRVITARVGETIPDAIEVIVGSLFGNPIPNVGLRIVNDDPNGATISCRGGIPLSDQTGLVVCDAVAGGRIGQTQARIIVGENVQFPITLTVTEGAAATIRITGGNNQTGNAGQALSQPLSVEVTDAGGNLLRGAPVVWEVVSGTATLTETSSATDSNGRASTRVTLGQQPGSVQIRVRSGSANATFAQTVTLNATRLEITGGNDQTAVTGQAFATPLTVRVIDAQSRPVPGAVVVFRVASGSAAIPATATTDTNGVASITATAGQTPGAVTISATIGALSQTFNLTVRTPGASFTASSFVNGAGYQPGISPGGIAVITASGIAPSVRGSVTPPTVVGPLPTTLAGVEVLFNNVAAPIYAVSNINGTETVIVQVPFETAPGQTSVTIRTAGGGTSTVNGVQIQAIRPGIFDYVDSTGRRLAVALRPDGSYISSSNPARRGEIIGVFAAGLGQTTPVTGTNRAGLRDQNVAATIISGINNSGVRTVSARLLEGAVGVYLVEMEIPGDTATGNSVNVAVGVSGGDIAGSTIPII